MNLYEIISELEILFNKLEFDDYGQVINFNNLSSLINALNIDKEKKVINIGRMIKNFSAESEAIKLEEEKLYARRKTLENKTEWLKKYLSSTIKGEQFKDATVEIKWRKSISVSICNEELIDHSYCYHLPEEWRPDKGMIRKAIVDGVKVEGASLVEKLNLQVK